MQKPRARNDSVPSPASCRRLVLDLPPPIPLDLIFHPGFSSFPLFSSLTRTPTITPPVVLSFLVFSSQPSHLCLQWGSLDGHNLWSALHLADGLPSLSAPLRQGSTGLRVEVYTTPCVSPKPERRIGGRHRRRSSNVSHVPIPKPARYFERLPLISQQLQPLPRSAPSSNISAPI